MDQSILGQSVGYLNNGIRVEVKHASFMTAGIPPQTTAYEVRILR